MRLQDRHVIVGCCLVGWGAIWLLGISLPVTSWFGFALRKAGAIGVLGAGCVFGLAELALWMRRSEQVRNERAFPIEPVDLVKMRRDELLSRDARKDGLA